MAIINSFAPFQYRNLIKAAIIPVVPSKKSGGEPVKGTEALGIFLLNPESWSVSKEANWVKHSIPGLSDPIQQWTSSKAKTVTFQALVTRDMQNPQKKSEVSASRSASGLVNVTAPLATSVLNRAGISFPANIEGAFTNSETLDLGITDKLNFYMSLVYPNTFAKGGRVYPPNPVRLSVGGTFGKRVGNSLYVVDKVEITITKQFADLTPIEALVSFTMTELVDRVLSSENDILQNG